jgi:hypothetical protein
LHLDAKINNTTLVIQPMVVNWNTVAMEDVLFDGKYFLEVDCNEVAYLAEERSAREIKIRTNYPDAFNAIELEGKECVDRIIGPMYGDEANQYIISAEASANTGSARDGEIIITVGNMRKTVLAWQMGATDDPAPTDVIPYVGAFWKAGQTGERLIRIMRPTTNPVNAIDGPWSATVVKEGGSGGWITLDRMMTDDPNVGWRLDNPNEEAVANGNDPGFDTRYAVHGGTSHVEGTVSSADLDGIYFRIGLKNDGWQPTATEPARYGVVLLSYTASTEPKHRLQRIWIRQGEGADYLIPKTDRAHEGNVRFTTYNVTVPKEMQSDYANKRRIKLDLQGGAWTDYPSQGGAYFQSKQTDEEYIRNAWHNAVALSTLPEGFMASIDGAEVGQYNASTMEVCPPGYRRPINSSEESLVETQQSLWTTISTGNNTDNSVWGYYADGFFDRRSTLGYNGRYANTSVALPSQYAAFVGRLFYYPGTSASIFFPMPGRVTWADTGGQTNQASYYWMNYTALSSTLGWAYRIETERASNSSAHNPEILGSVRCVKAPPIPEENGGSNHVLYFDTGSDGKGMVRVGRWNTDALTIEDYVMGIKQVPGLSDLAYFKFGGVVGFVSRGGNQTYFDVAQNDVRFNPSTSYTPVDLGSENINNLNEYEAIPAATSSDFVTPNTHVSDPAYHNLSNVLAGKGDPCKLAGLTVTEIRGGKIDNGLWRLPTTNENYSFTGVSQSSYLEYVESSGYPTAGVNKFPKGTAQGVSLPAAGSLSMGARVTEKGQYGYYWSSKPIDNNQAHCMYFSNGSFVGGYTWNTYGHPIRCVRQARQ